MEVARNHHCLDSHHVTRYAAESSKLHHTWEIYTEIYNEMPYLDDGVSSQP